MIAKSLWTTIGPDQTEDREDLLGVLKGEARASRRGAREPRL